MFIPIYYKYKAYFEMPKYTFSRYIITHFWCLHIESVQYFIALSVIIYVYPCIYLDRGNTFIYNCFALTYYSRLIYLYLYTNILADMYIFDYMLTADGKILSVLSRECTTAHALGITYMGLVDIHTYIHDISIKLITPTRCNYMYVCIKQFWL